MPSSPLLLPPSLPPSHPISPWIKKPHCFPSPAALSANFLALPVCPPPLPLIPPICPLSSPRQPQSSERLQPGTGFLAAWPAWDSGPPGAPAPQLAPPGCLDRPGSPRPRAQICGQSRKWLRPREGGAPRARDGAAADCAERRGAPGKGAGTPEHQRCGLQSVCICHLSDVCK